MICRNEGAVIRYTITIRYSRHELLCLKKTRTSGLLCRNVLFDAICGDLGLGDILDWVIDRL